MLLVTLISRQLLSEKTNNIFKHTTEQLENSTIATAINNVIKISSVKTDSIIYDKITRPDGSPTITGKMIANVSNTTEVIVTPSIISALMEEDVIDTTVHRIALIILIGIFMVISLVISITVIVFCKKKNSVFMLQKCEQDSDLEMDDINTEVDTSDSEYEPINSPKHTSKTRSETYPCLSKYVNENINEIEMIKNRENINRNKLKPLKNGLIGSSSSAIPLLHNSVTGTEKMETKTAGQGKRHSDSQLLSSGPLLHQTAFQSPKVKKKVTQNGKSKATSQKTIDLFRTSMTSNKDKNKVTSTDSKRQRKRGAKSVSNSEHVRVVSPDNSKLANKQSKKSVQSRKRIYSDSVLCQDDDETVLVNSRLEIL